MNKFYFWGLLFLLSCSNEQPSKLELYEEFYEDGTLSSSGFLKSNGEREGLWVYRTESGNLLGKGLFNKDFRKGQWEYGKMTFNDTKFITWEVKEFPVCRLNIPEEFNIKILNLDSSDIIHANYEDVIMNVILLDSEGKSISEVEKDLIRKNKTNEKYQLLEKTYIEVNSLKGRRLVQRWDIQGSGSERYVDNYLIPAPKNNGTFVIFCIFPMDRRAKRFHTVFSEIVFSLREIQEELVE